MKRIGYLFIVLAIALLPAFASAHPPAVDPHNSCVVKYSHEGTTTPLVPVIGTLSYLAPLGTSFPQCLPPASSNWGPYSAEFGSHAGACLAEGAIAGAYCGPIVPPGGFATCAWFPVVNTVPTMLIIGFDGFLPRGLPGMDGFVNLATSGEIPVFGPFPPSPTVNPAWGWTVPNPYPVPARVIAFPTDVGPYPPGALAPGDVNLIQCD